MTETKNKWGFPWTFMKAISMWNAWEGNIHNPSLRTEVCLKPDVRRVTATCIVALCPCGRVFVKRLFLPAHSLPFSFAVHKTHHPCNIHTHRHKHMHSKNTQTHTHTHTPTHKYIGQVSEVMLCLERIYSFTLISRFVSQSSTHTRTYTHAHIHTRKPPKHSHQNTQPTYHHSQDIGC